MRDWNWNDTTVGLAGWSQQLRELLGEFLALASSLDAAALNWRPAPERWSIGQILDHLAVTTRALAPPLAAKIDAARARGVTGTPPFHYSRMGRWFIDEVAPPPRRRLRSPRPYRPAS